MSEMEYDSNARQSVIREVFYLHPSKYNSVDSQSAESSQPDHSLLQVHSKDALYPVYAIRPSCGRDLSMLLANALWNHGR